MESRTSLCSRIARLAALVLFVAFYGRAIAQTVTISPQTGNVVSAASYSSESHVSGYGGAWIHNQIPLTLLTSDEATLSDEGLVKVHANNVGVQDGKLGLISGHGTTKNHMTVSLPKGYRFTGYTIVMNYETWHSDNDAMATTFRETKSNFTSTIKQVTVSSGAKKVTMSRTSLTGNDMGNILYFLQDHDRGHSTVSVESFTVSFECADPFTEAMQPGSSMVSGVDCIAMPFATQRVDLGQITQETKNGYTSYKYNYNNVKDLHANFLLFDEGGIKNGTATENAKTNGNIVATAASNGRQYIGLKNDTYWIEAPATAQSQTGNDIPVGYRIVGAALHYTNTTNTAFSLGDDIYITDGNGNYMNASLEFTTTKTVWHTDSEGRVYTGSSTYLTHDKRGNTRSSDLKTTTTKRNAREYKTNGNDLYWNSDYISYTADGKASYAGTRAIVMNANATSTGDFTLTLYDKTGNTAVQTVQVNGNTVDGYVTLDDANNDAIKFKVEGLEEGKAAYVAIELRLEALNPYVDKMDIACTRPDGSKTLSNQYLTTDFTVGVNGKVDFTVPVNFADGKMKFSFEQLHHKSADETYAGIGMAGKHARYNFVKSDYYNLIDENLQAHRTEAADYDYTKKIRTDVAGTSQFKVNNSDRFKAGTTGSGTFSYEEFRYSNAEYATQGGTWTAVELADGGQQECYLVVCDETRYNIAPTTTPRHAVYAYYYTEISLSTKNFVPVLTYRTVYDNAMLSGGLDNNRYVGVSVGINDDSGTPATASEGYVYAKQIVDRLNADIAAKAEGAPVDAKHVLYIDASELNSVLFSADQAEWGSIASLQDIIAANAMVYLPKGTSVKANNVATLAESGGDFVADNNIVLTDQLPFFAPADIRVDAANHVAYSRKVTRNNTGTQWISSVLPFTVAVDEEGRHNAEDGIGKISFYTMNADNALDNMQTEDNHDYSVVGHFSPVTNAISTEANKPYLIGIEEFKTDDSGEKVILDIRQHGATIVKTPTTDTGAGQTRIEGETATATIGTASATLTQYGTFNGLQIDKNEGVFYFSRDRFVSSLNLNSRYPHVYIMPFRTWYDCTSQGMDNVRTMFISLDPSDTTNAIDNIATDADDTVALSAADGMLMVKALRDTRAVVRNVGGLTVKALTMKAGDVCRVPLAAGIYVVNGMKVLVK